MTLTAEDIETIHQQSAQLATEAAARIRTESGRHSDGKAFRRTWGLCLKHSQELAAKLAPLAVRSREGGSWQIHESEEMRRICESPEHCDDCRSVPLDLNAWPKEGAYRGRAHHEDCGAEALAAFERTYTEPPTPIMLDMSQESLLRYDLAVWLIWCAKEHYWRAEREWLSSWPCIGSLCPGLPSFAAPGVTTKKKRADDLPEEVLSVLRNTGDRLTRTALIQMVGGLDKNNALEVMDALIESGKVLMEKEGTTKYFRAADE
ncbi:MAG: hypothetical protein FWE39_00145 [Nocardiaceae bacterium]|nr:hypothetical protein [Nocardiaceae bacterium]